MTTPVWYAHYWVVYNEKKMGFGTAKEAYDFLNAGSAQAHLFAEGIILPDGTEIKTPYFGTDVKVWEALGKDPVPATTSNVVGGHAFINDEDGNIKFEEVSDYHDYIECARCGQYKCPNCDESFLTEQCPEYGNTLPGLDF